MKKEKQPAYLEGKQTIVRMGKFQDIPSILSYYHKNHEHLTPFEPRKPPIFFEEIYWQIQIGKSIEDYKKDLALRMFLFEKERPEQVQGVINFTAFSRGAFQNAFLGYGLSKECEGKGIMFDALSHSIDFVFNHLNLHRISANYMPFNTRSGNLLKRLGFRVEGYAYDYLKINDSWEDHVLTSKINPNFKE